MTERNLANPSERIRPAAFEPPGGRAAPSSGRRRRLPLVIAAGVLLLVLVALGLSMRPVEIEIQPQPEQMTLGGWALKWGDRQLALPGAHTLRARHAGYKPLQRVIDVPGDGPAQFEFELEPLPGLLSLETVPENARVSIDGETHGEAPLQRLELAAGKHQLEVAAEGHATETRELVIEGREKHQSVHIELEPARARVAIDSNPGGAEIRRDGKTLAATPATVELDRGSHILRLSKPGFEPRELSIALEGGDERDLGVIELTALGAQLRVTSEPSGAQLSIDGEPRGRTPVSVAVKPGQPARVELSHAGYKPLHRTVELARGTEKTFRGVLEKLEESAREQTERPEQAEAERARAAAAATEASTDPATREGQPPAGLAGGSPLGPASAAAAALQGAAGGDRSRQGGGGQNSGAGAATALKPPPDIPEAGDDDIVARQLREAAENETDPELRARLWEEYREYKASQR